MRKRWKRENHHPLFSAEAPLFASSTGEKRAAYRPAGQLGFSA